MSDDSASAPGAGIRIHLIVNAYWDSLDFELPTADRQRPWHRWIDTSLESPEDIVQWHTAPAHAERVYRAGPRSVVTLWAPLADIAVRDHPIGPIPNLDAV